MSGVTLVKPDLDTLTVEDVMVRDVITISAEAPVADLVRLFDFWQIRGAPVLDGKGKLAGVVSVTDVVRLAAHAREIDAGDTAAPYRYAEQEDVPFSYFFETHDHRAARDDANYLAGDSVFEETSVRDIMTAATFTVRPDASLVELARFMVRGRIHRSLVVKGERLLGIVTAFDIVRAVAGEHTVERTS